MSIEITEHLHVDLDGQVGEVADGLTDIPLEQVQEELSNRSWPAWQKHFTRRKKPARPQKSFGSQSSFLQWVVANEKQGKSLQRVALLVKSSGKIKPSDERLLGVPAEMWSNNSLTASDALLAVGIAALLPELTSVTNESTWTSALAHLIRLPEHQATEENELVRQLLGVELPCLLAYLFPELDSCTALAGPACELMEYEQDTLLDSDGCIEAYLLGEVPAFLATWTRSWLLIDKLGFELDRVSQEKWEWFIRLALRLLRRDGTSMLGPQAWRVDAELYQTALLTSTDRDDRAIGRVIWPEGKSVPRQVPQEGGTYSEWAGMGVLQSSWSPRTPRMAVTTIDEHFAMEVCRGSTLFTIEGIPSLSIGDEVLIGEWEEVCWHGDHEVDYLELELEVSDDVRLQRQICLLRQHDALFFADTLLGETTRRMEYQLDIRLADSVTGLPEGETTEMYLQGKKIRSLLLPLGLPEWRAARTDDRFTCDGQSVRLRQSAVTRNLCAGLFVDLNPARSIKPRTWRTLTVGEELEIVGPDVAVAWRVRIGKQQWVIYRSLEGPGNRTFLGQNHLCDFFIGQFEKDGTVTELLTIEA